MLGLSYFPANNVFCDQLLSNMTKCDGASQPLCTLVNRENQEYRLAWFLSENAFFQRGLEKRGDDSILLCRVKRGVIPNLEVQS